MASIPQQALDQLFLDARTQNGWLARPVPDELLRQVYDLARMGPTSMNCQPMRLVFLRTPEAKERLVPALSAGNVDKVRAAPVTAIVATDTRFYENMPRLFFREGAREMFAGNAELASATAARNGTLQGGYFILAARALGLDTGPMSGFDIPKVNAEFFPDGRYAANFLCSLGYGDPGKLLERQYRLEFDEAAILL